MSSKKRKPYARDKEERIALVCKISQDVIDNEGYESLTMNLIHKRTKIPIGTLYKDFPDGKEDILLEIVKEYKDEFETSFDKFDDKKLREYIFKALDTGRRRRSFLIALQIETLKSPDSFIQKAKKYIPEVDLSSFKRAVEYIAGYELDMRVVIEMITVWKSIARQHIIFRNIYGSDEDFFNLIVRVIKGLAK